MSTDDSRNYLFEHKGLYNLHNLISTQPCVQRLGVTDRPGGMGGTGARDTDGNERI